MHHRAAGRRRGVDGFSQAAKARTELIDPLDDRQQILERARQAGSKR